MGWFSKKDPIGAAGSQADANNQLQLRTKTLDAVLKTKFMSTKARVVFCIDGSGSMSTMYKNGTVQSLVERLMPVAVKFDDNGEMEVYIFSNDFVEIVPANKNNFFGYVGNVAMKSVQYGGTSYAPIMQEIVNRYGIENPSKDPTFVIFVTDGDNDDHSAAQKVIIQASKANIFWKFVGIGNQSFTFLKKLDTMSGRTVDNANFFEVDDITTMGDDDLYKGLIEEFDKWQNAARAAKIL